VSSDHNRPTDSNASVNFRNISLLVLNWLTHFTVFTSLIRFFVAKIRQSIRSWLTYLV
jgi:hypothetical protein